MIKDNTTWNLNLLYKSENDPQIEKDIQTIEKSYSAFEKKYRGKDFTSDPKDLLSALKEMEELWKKLSHAQPAWYFNLRLDLNSEDDIARANSTKISQRITNAQNKIHFFGIAISKIPKKEQGRLLKDPKFERYQYYLKKIFNYSPHLLSEGEEQLANLLSQTSYSMWVSGQNKVLNQQTIIHKGKELPFPEAVSILSDLPKKDRQILNKKINDKLISNSDFPESELNAIYNYKKIMDTRRRFKKPYSSTVLGHETDEKTVENLVLLVSKNFRISHRFYKLHAKLLKEKKITTADRSVKIGEIKKKFDFPTSLKIVKDAFKKVDDQYAELLDTFVENGQIDVYPKKGKEGGAYCSGGGKNLPTYVLLNHTDDIRSVETLAHEMGHAIHTELCKRQSYLYANYTIATAEVASTFFEQLIISELENELSPEENLILLHDKIMGDMATIFRQIAFFNFELELHNEIREKGQVSKENIAKLMKRHLQSYVGDAMEVTDDDGYFFVYLSHIRRFFYVYTYTYGQLISRALFEKWKQDPSYSKKIEQFLSAGSSMSPKDIFKKIGIDTSNSSFFETGLKGIEKDIDKLEKLARKVKRI